MKILRQIYQIVYISRFYRFLSKVRNNDWAVILWIFASAKNDIINPTNFMLLLNQHYFHIISITARSFKLFDIKLFLQQEDIIAAVTANSESEVELNNTSRLLNPLKEFVQIRSSSWGAIRSIPTRLAYKYYFICCSFKSRQKRYWYSVMTHRGHDSL